MVGKEKKKTEMYCAHGRYTSYGQRGPYVLLSYLT